MGIKLNKDDIKALDKFFKENEDKSDGTEPLAKLHEEDGGEPYQDAQG